MHDLKNKGLEKQVNLSFPLFSFSTRRSSHLNFPIESFNLRKNMANALLQVTNLNALLTYQNLLPLSGRLLFELQSNITSLKRTNTF